MQRETENLVKHVVTAVLKNVDTGHVKTRWNACHALAHMLRSPHFPMGAASYTPHILKSLKTAIVSCKNFKVRIAAAGALAEVQSLNRLASNVVEQKRIAAELIETVSLALTKTDDLVGSQFGEFKYQDQLKDQLQTTLTTLTSLS